MTEVDALRWLRQRDESREHGDALARAAAAYLRGETERADLEAALRRYVEVEAPSLRGAVVPDQTAGATASEILDGLAKLSCGGRTRGETSAEYLARVGEALASDLSALATCADGLKAIAAAAGLVFIGDPQTGGNSISFDAKGFAAIANAVEKLRGAVVPSAP